MKIAPSRGRGRPFVILPEDVRLYYEAMYAVVSSSEWPWTSERGPLHMRETPNRDDELPTPERLLVMMSYLNPAALQAVKARARQIRHRRKSKPVCVHLDLDAWSVLSAYARRENITLSEAVRRTVPTCSGQADGSNADEPMSPTEILNP